MGGHRKYKRIQCMWPSVTTILNQQPNETVEKTKTTPAIRARSTFFE